MNTKILNIILIVFFLLGIFMPYSSTTASLLAGDELRQKSKDELSWSTRDSIGVDQATLIADPEDALNVRFALIDSAKDELFVTNYSIHNDTVGYAFLAKVLDAADRGVKVKILIDGFMGSLSDTVARTLASYPNIQMARYNPIRLWAPWNWNELMHDKFMVVDKKYLLLGGRNLDKEHYFPLDSGRVTKFDWDVLVERTDMTDKSSVLTEIQRYNTALWNSPKTKAVAQNPQLTKRQAKKEQHNLKLIRQSSHQFFNQYPSYTEKTLTDYLDDAVETRKITLLHNPLTSGKKEPWVAIAIKDLALQAEEEILIQTPYITKSKWLMETLETVNKQAQVSILTNSLASSPNYPAFSNYVHQRQDFIDTGVCFYEFQAEHSIHGKAFTLDDQISIVGSFNIDSRSHFINTETMLVIDSPEFTQKLKTNMKLIQENSLKVSLDNRYIPSQTLEAEEVSILKKLLMKVCYILLKPVEFFL